MRPSFLWTAVLLCLIAKTAQGEVINFQFSRDVHTGDLERDQLLAIRLDSDIYANLQRDFADLRLVEEKGVTVPYLLRRVRTTRASKVRETWTPDNFTAKPLPGGGLEITVQLDEKDPHPTGLTVITPLGNFEQRVQISVSPDGQQWQPVEREAVIFDYSRYMDVRQTSIEFPESDHRFFRIVIDDVTAEQESELLELTRRLTGEKETERFEEVTIARRPFRIERIDFWRETLQDSVVGDEKTSYEVKSILIEEDREKQQTLVRIDTRKQPLTRFKLITPEKNFSRQVTVEVSHKKGAITTWQPISTAVLSRIDYKSLQRDELTVEFPETRHAEYRLVINNRDNVPLKVEDVEAQGNVYELVFLAEPAEVYQLLYGNHEAEPPVYDTVAVETLLTQGFQPVQTDLGSPQAAAFKAEPRAYQWRELINNAILLGGVILLLILFLGSALYTAARRMDSLEGEPPE